VYLLPFLSMPFVSIVTGWIAGFWNRRTELTSDRLALMYLEDGELVKNALVKIHVGPDVAQAMNQTARDWLRHNAERPMNRFAQTFSSHPFLVRRISHIDRYKSVVEGTTAAE
jgi:Zn-dependent protease with chaperone function